MKSKSFLFLLFSSLLFTLSGCYYDNYEELHPSAATTNCDTAKVISYATDIVPILNASCGTNNSCHSATNTSGYDLTDYTGVNNTVLAGLLESSVVWDGNSNPMPKGSSTKLPVCDITKIKKWIANGALNN